MEEKRNWSKDVYHCWATWSISKKNALLSVGERWLRERQTNVLLIVIFCSVLFFSYVRRCSFSSIMPSLFFFCILSYHTISSLRSFALADWTLSTQRSSYLGYCNRCCPPLLYGEKEKRKLLTTVFPWSERREWLARFIFSCFPAEQAFLPRSPAELEHFFSSSSSPSRQSWVGEKQRKKNLILVAGSAKKQHIHLKKFMACKVIICLRIYVICYRISTTLIESLSSQNSPLFRGTVRMATPDNESVYLQLPAESIVFSTVSKLIDHSMKLISLLGQIWFGREVIWAREWGCGRWW